MVPHPIPTLCAQFVLPAPQPSRRHHAQSLLGPSFRDPRTHHALESHPEQAAPDSRRGDERQHAVSSHSAHALRLYSAACNLSSICRFWVSDRLCSNLSQSFHYSDTCDVPSVRNTVGLFILINICPVFTFLQQLMTKVLWVIYIYTCSLMFSIDVVASAPDDSCICW